MALKSKKWLDVEDCASEYGIAPSTQALYRRERKIPFSKVGGFIRYSRAKLDEWLESHTIETEERSGYAIA